MNKMTILSMIATALLFNGCGNDSQKSVSGATSKAVESTKEAASSVANAAKEATQKAVEATKEAAGKVADATEEAVAASKEAAADAVESTKKIAANAVGAAANVVLDEAGKATYAKCSGCHGTDGKTKALGKSAILAGQTKNDLLEKINAYKAGTRNVSGMGNLMQGQVAGLDDTAVEAVATYISSLK